MHDVVVWYTDFCPTLVKRTPGGAIAKFNGTVVWVCPVALLVLYKLRLWLAERH